MEIIRQAARLFGHKNKQFETLTELNTQGHKIRIWRAAKTLELAKVFEQDQFQEQMSQIASSVPRDKWEVAFMRLRKVSCVTIVDANGNGIACYPDWG